MGLKPAALLLASALIVTGCGYRGQLSRIEPEGKSREELRAARAEEKASVERSLAGQPEHRPVRVDDISIRMQERTDDPFNLPPER